VWQFTVITWEDRLMTFGGLTSPGNVVQGGRTKVPPGGVSELEGEMNRVLDRSFVWLGSGETCGLP
jgi:hypothetical protein